MNSPEEAEAQCCDLQRRRLVDIVASDDSDVWVFGASLVCRHLFGGGSKEKSKETSAYCLRDIQEQLGSLSPDCFYHHRHYCIHCCYQLRLGPSTVRTICPPLW